MNEDIVTWEINQGEDFKRTIEVEDEAGNPVDLTGYTAKMQLRSSPGHINVYLTASSDTGEFTVINGKLELSIESAVIDALTFNQAVGDLFIFDQAGEPEKLINIRAKLVKKVTEWLP